MKIGYILNTYPVTSGTFIRREIEALERRGVEVKRFAVRRWDQQLVDTRDQEEQARTEYLLSGNAGSLLRATIRELITNLPGVMRSLGPWREIAGQTDGFFRPLAYLAEAMLLKQRCADENVHHLHSHFGTNATAVAMLSRLMGGPSYSFTGHGPDEFDHGAKMRFDLKVEHAAFVVAISHFARMQLIRWGGHAHRDKIIIGRCGLDLRDFEPSAVPARANTFVCVGRLCPQKGQALIPEAVAPLVTEYPDLKILLIGDGESRGEIEDEIKRLGLEGNIELAGWMENRKVLDELRSAKALLLPSFAEGLPIVIMEALALGRPAISTYIAGIPELLDEDCGWIFPASSVDGLRHALRSALSLSHDELSDLGAEGRRRIEERHSVNGLAEVLHQAFAGALGEATSTFQRSDSDSA